MVRRNGVEGSGCLVVHSFDMSKRWRLSLFGVASCTTDWLATLHLPISTLGRAAVLDLQRLDNRQSIGHEAIRRRCEERGGDTLKRAGRNSHCSSAASYAYSTAAGMSGRLRNTKRELCLCGSHDHPL